jgi:hypothetical protein
MAKRATNELPIQPVTLTVHCTRFPGRSFAQCEDLEVGWGQGKTVMDAVPGDSVEARFTAHLHARQRADGTVDFAGPLVQGKSGERFLYLVWTCAADRKTPLRRIKVPLHQLTWEDLQNGQIVAHLQMTGPDGGPLAATPKAPYLRWEFEPVSQL